MADKRTCYAGDLTSDAIGKTIRFEAGNETARTVYTDILVAVTHRREEPANLTALDILNPKFVTTLHLQRLKWTKGTMFGMSIGEDVGIAVDHTLIVEILP